jgi:hypothetical protein
MRRWQALWLTALFHATAVSAALAQTTIAPSPSPPGGAGVPGPIAGAGLPILLIGGGYYLVRRWRKH